MPRNVRNFWVEADVDGRKEKIAFGPRSASGCISMKIKVRENGEIFEHYIYIGCVADEDGNLEVYAENRQGRKTLYKGKR